jgi:Isochorismatase family
MVNRIRRDQCCGIIVDVQEFFLAQLDKRLRPKIEANTRNLATLLGYFRIPLVVNGLPDTAASFEKDFFDLTKEDAIRSHLKGLKKKQAIVAGCETDVCVLQSCLGLLELGYQVFLVEELLFSSAANVDAAIARLKSEGAVFVSYKTVFYELFEAVETGEDELVAQFGPVPDLPDAAV